VAAPVSSPAPAAVDTPAWLERAWVRALRGARGRPLGLVLLIALVALMLRPELAPTRLLRLAGFDAYHSLLPRARASAPAVIVAIDEASLAHHGQWPWPRTLLARLVKTIAEADPAAIGIDILMPEPDRLSPGRVPALVPGMDRDLAERLLRLPSNDAALADALRSLPVVLGLAGLDAPEPTATASGLRAPPVRAFGGDPGPFVKRFVAALKSVDEIDAAAPGHGLLSLDLDAGVVRRIRLVAAVGPTIMPTLGIEMLRVARGEPAVSVRVGPRGIEAVGVGDLLVPTQPDGSVWLHYSRHDPARFVSAGEVLSGRADPRQFARKLVLVGATALGLSDYPPTPVAERMPGVEIHAQLIEGILDGDLLFRPGVIVWAEMAILLVGGLLFIWVVPALPVRTSAALLLLVIGLLVALAVLLYLMFHILFDAVSPAVALGGLFTVMLSVTLAEAEGQRRALRRQVELQREAAARLAGELEAARRIQMGILPSAAAAFPGERRFDLYAFLEPAREVGGDLYDFFRLDEDRILLLIGDVSGKGLPGSLFMALAKSLLKSIALRRSGDIGAVMREADREISRDNAEGLFVTAFAAVLDARTGEVEYCNAGHDAPYLLPRRAETLGRLDGEGGPPLCVVDDFPYAAVSYRMRPGEALCLVTDGVTEATSVGDRFYGRERLAALLAALPPGAGVREVGEAVRADVGRFAAGVEPADDLAILVLRWNGPASSP